MLPSHWPARVRYYCALCRFIAFWRVQRASSGSGTRSTLTFYTDRRDGLGARLLAAVWGKVLADHYGAEYLISWPMKEGGAEYHATETAEDIFSPEFMRNYVRGEIPLHSANAIPMRRFLIEYFPCFPAQDLFVQAEGPSSYRRLVWLALGKNAFSRTFDSFDFSPKIKRAIYYSRLPEVHPDTIAVHLRSGDIVHGKFRRMDTYASKVIPYRLACAYVSEQRSRGKQVLLFGQDAELGRAIADAYGARWASDLMPNDLKSGTERAFFDVGLMAGCSKIVAGASDFARLAATIGGRPSMTLSTYWSYSRTVELLLAPAASDVDAAASDLQRAFSYWSAARLIVRNDLKDWAKAVECLNSALKLDPGNFIYTFVKAAIYYSNNQRANADALIESIQDIKEHGLIFLLTHSNGPVRRYLPLLRSAARSGSGWASLCVAFDHTVSAKDRRKFSGNALCLPTLNPELRDLLERI